MVHESFLASLRPQSVPFPPSPSLRGLPVVGPRLRNPTPQARLPLTPRRHETSQRQTYVGTGATLRAHVLLVDGMLTGGNDRGRGDGGTVSHRRYRDGEKRVQPPPRPSRQAWRVRTLPPFWRADVPFPWAYAFCFRHHHSPDGSFSRRTVVFAGSSSCPLRRLFAVAGAEDYASRPPHILSLRGTHACCVGFLDGN